MPLLNQFGFALSQLLSFLQQTNLTLFKHFQKLSIVVCKMGSKCLVFGTLQSHLLLLNFLLLCNFVDLCTKLVNLLVFNIYDWLVNRSNTVKCTRLVNLADLELRLEWLDLKTSRLMQVFNLGVTRDKFTRFLLKLLLNVNCLVFKVLNRLIALF